MVSFKFLFKNRQAKVLLYLGLINIVIAGFLFYTSHASNSLALSAFSYLVLFDFLSIFTAILNIWVKFQSSNGFYPYGYKRFDVLAIFSCTILTILGAFFNIKEGFESLFEEKDVHTGRLLPATLIGFLFHMIVTLGVKNEPFDYVVKSSTSSWLQEHIFDLSESMSRYIPGLSKLLLPRVNPFILIGCADLLTLLTSSFLIQMGSSYLIDTYASILIACMTIGTMLPFAIYTGKILLQTTPAHLLTQLDKSLREASTLDGVLEFRDEHFWTLSLGVLVGSLHVRIRRDADEQLVLAHVWNKLAGLVQILTVHIFKDDWMRRTTHQLVYPNQHQQLNTNIVAAPLPPLPPLQPLQSQLPLNVTNQSSNYMGITSNTSLNLNNVPTNQLNSRINTTSGSNRGGEGGGGGAMYSSLNRNIPASIVENDFVIVNP